MAQLKHNWLENTILAWQPDELVYAWEQTGWAELERQCMARVEEAVDLIERVEHGFSPAQLMYNLEPLAGLSDECRANIANLLHQSYLESTGIEVLTREAREILTALKGALGLFFAVWNGPVTVETEGKVREGWVLVSLQARLLRDILDRMPKGVSLP